MPKKNPRDGLSPNEKRFCVLYVENGRNATRAYQAIYPTCRDNSAATKGSLWLRKVNVQNEIQRLTSTQFEKEHMGAEEALAQMARLARSDVGDLYWKPGERDSAGIEHQAGERKALHDLPEAIRKCVKSIEMTQFGVKISLWDKPGMITNALKVHKKLGEATNINITLGFSERLRAAREKRLKGGA